MKYRLLKILACLILLPAPAWAQQGKGAPATAAEREATTAILRGDFARAASLATARLKKNPRDARWRVLLARAEMGQGNLQTALAELRRALEIDPRQVDALYYLALIAGALGPQTYERLYQLAPNSDRVHQLLAEAALAQENQAEAETEYRAAIESNPRSAEALLGLAELKRTQSKFDEALSLYRQAESISGLNHDIAYGIGVCLSYQQEHAKALDYFRRAAAFAPDAEATQFALGNALFQVGRIREAIAPLKRAIAINPKIKQAYLLLGRIYQRLGQTQAAKAAFQRVEELTRAEIVN